MVVFRDGNSLYKLLGKISPREGPNGPSFDEDIHMLTHNDRWPLLIPSFSSSSPMLKEVPFTKGARKLDWGAWEELVGSCNKRYPMQEKGMMGISGALWAHLWCSGGYRAGINRWMLWDPQGPPIADQVFLVAAPALTLPHTQKPENPSALWSL